jgi:hypothetical protein
MPTTLQNTIDIACAPRTLYDYVTQPWRWHEWHPSSRSARATVDTLQVGDEFDEVVELQPLSPLPLTLRRQTRYCVRVAEPAQRWEVEGAMRDGWLRIGYRFAPQGDGTRFERTLDYGARGPSRLLMPLLRARTARLSVLALDNLKRKMEGR